MKKHIILISAAALMAAVSCSDEIKYEELPSAHIATGIDVVYTSEDIVKLYTDEETGAKVLPMLTGSTVTLSFNITPDASTLLYPGVVWSSSNSDVASVTNGVIYASSEGSTTITVESEAINMAASTSFLVRVSDSVNPVTAIEISDNTTETDEETSLPKIALGETVQLTAKVTPSDATFRTVKWSSNDESKATVDAASGLATAVGEGRVTFTATAIDGSAVSATHEIFIEQIHMLEGLKAATTSYTMSVTDDPLSLAYEVYPENATRSLISWESSDETIATVDSKGKVTPKRYGKVSITMSCPEESTSAAPEGYSKSVAIEVNIPAGYYAEHFVNPDNTPWYLNSSHVSSGATQVREVNNTTGEAYILFTPYLTNITGRGDIQHRPKTYISTDYPILTFRIEDVNDRTWDKSGTPTKYSRNINIDNSGNIDEGAGTKYAGNIEGNNKWAVKYLCSDGSAILVYDISTQKFVTGGVLPTGAICWMNTFQIKYADINKNGNTAVTASDISYKMYWFHTFKDYNEMNTYLSSWSGKTGITYEQK